MGEMRSNRQADALRVQAESAVGVDSLKHDLARTQDALESVNGTLSALVDRLARIEGDIREEGRRRTLEPDPLELTQPVGRVTARTAPEMAPPIAPEHLPVLDLPLPAEPQPQPRPVAPPVAVAVPEPQSAPAPSRRPMPQAKQGPIDPDLPPDQPLEPGSGPPRPRAGARIAVNEPHPSGAAATAAPAAGTSSFIAAARRAAQNAVQAGSRPVRPQPQDEETIEGDAPRGLMKRMKSLFVAASIVAIAVGGLQIAGSFMHGKPAPTRAATDKPADRAVAATEDTAAPAPPNAALSPLAPAPAAPSSILTDPTPLVPIPPMSNPLAAPALSGPPQPNTQATKSDITGSIPAAANNTGAAERLPTEIGGPKLRNAALHGDAAAAYEIGVRFADGRGVPANATEAARWYERASSKGIALAQFRYASMLEKGHGVKKDLAQARRLYLAAATRGNAKAMHNLAVLYAEGVDGRPDYTNAVQWFRKAAAYGISDSEYNLGVLAARGLGTTKNLTEAYQWFTLAADHGDKEAGRKRDEVASQMDPTSVATAQRAVKSFVVKPQPHDAVAVAVPPGGWDDAPAPAAHGKTRPGPLALGAYKLGRR
jgi:localization factor PodJL